MKNLLNYVLIALSVFSFHSANAQVFGSEGVRYNEKNFDQDFVYDFSLDSANTISGSIIQENKSVDKEWCAYLKVTAQRKDKSVIAVFANAPHKLEAKGKDYNGKVFSQKVNWKLKEPCYELSFEAVTSCTPMSAQ